MLKKRYRLGLDMGSSSIGWAMILLDKDNEAIGVERLGVRIFPDGREDKTKEPLSVSRRMSRGARRNRDRFLGRMRLLLRILHEHGFLPQNDAEKKAVFAQDPYELRSRALDKKLSKAEFGRALFHLAKRRGFQSNRKTDNEESISDFKGAILNLQEELEKSSARSLGEYLYQKSRDWTDEQKKPSLRFRYKELAAGEIPIFPQRDMLKQEFELIWEKQKTFYPEYKVSVKEEIYQAIFYQNPLKPVPKGKCIFEPNAFRAPKAHPVFQEYRILQDVNNLILEDLRNQEKLTLTPEQRQIIINILKQKDSETFAALRKAIFQKEGRHYKFNFETENKKQFDGDKTAIRFLKNPLLNPLWQALDFIAKGELIELLLSEIDDTTLLTQLVAKGYTQEQAEALHSLNLPPDYANLSLIAMRNILPFLRQGYKYHEACQMAGYKHSEHYNGTVYHDSDLPYYGALLPRAVLPLARISHDTHADEYGKINNPTVHIALNQIRNIINVLEKLYGPPTQIVMELARDLKMGQKEKELYEKKLRANTKNNERIAAELHKLQIPNNAENRNRYKLWEELNSNPLERRCIYSGIQISIERLFSEEFEIEHILPKSRTYDDSMANKTISHISANRYKGEKSPYEAFGNSSDAYDWEAIVQRAAHLPDNKRRRFLKDAMQAYTDEGEVLARMLNDTRYMSRVAKEYLQYVVGDRQIWVVTGQQTATFRGKWGLNAILQEDGSNIKNRDDHRHHAIDAFVIGMMNRSMINRFSTAVKSAKDRFLEKIGDPYTGFDYHAFKEKVLSLKVSFKPEHSDPATLRKRKQTAGALLKETAYGYWGPDPKNPKYHLYTERKALGDMKPKDIERIIDPIIHHNIETHIGGDCKEDEFKVKIAEWGKEHNVKKLKLWLKSKPANMIGIKDKDGNTYKYFAPGENLFMDVYQTQPWNPDSPWHAEIINSYNAHQTNFVPNWKKEYPMAKLIMRLYKNDILCFDGETGREYRIFRKMTNNIAYLRVLHVARRPKGKEDIGEQFSPNKLKELNARKAGIDIVGRAFDPFQVQINADIRNQS